jgi:dTDP-glucose 4,6-dehydratase
MQETDVSVVNLDCVTYAADFKNLSGVDENPRYKCVRGDILDGSLVLDICKQESIEAIVHFAAESHVDRSIHAPDQFLKTNILGTASLLEAVKQLRHIHFHHVSTDEVFGSLGQTGFFNEASNYSPNSPYSASKASSDHLVRAYGHTYDLSYTISHCSNNYGPGQYPEKFIPLMITNCLAGKKLPVYGTGQNRRDWLYVDDHVEGVWQILQKGRAGQSYGFGGGVEMSNLQMLHCLIDLLAEQMQTDPNAYRSLIEFIPDRLGHDFRYAIDYTKATKELGWHPRTDLRSGLERTIQDLRTCKTALHHT